MTVECNPDTVTTEVVAAYRDAGVNRLSLGVQSMVPSVLSALGRTHDPDNVRRSVELARAGGIESLNLDLIYGAAGESVDDWCHTLDQALALEPSHVSAYGLTVEPGTALALRPERHPDDDDQADKYLLATERLGAAGFEWYEISNWARPGEQCRHNLLYWGGGEYQGVGCAANSHRAGRRFWNVRTPERYIDATEGGRSVEAGDERLREPERRLEALQLSLRTAHGVPAAALPLADLGAGGDLDDLVAVDGDRAVLTVAGRLLANEVALRLQP
ncbi:hypothetical protein BH24ACT3_BH24ACT3_05830 [soil metagenome]